MCGRGLDSKRSSEKLQRIMTKSDCLCFWGWLEEASKPTLEAFGWRVCSMRGRGTDSSSGSKLDGWYKFQKASS